MRESCGETSSCEESKNSPRMNTLSPCRPGPDGSDIAMVSAAVCVGASTIATGEGSLVVAGQKNGFRSAAAGLSEAANNNMRLLHLTSPSLHRYLQHSPSPGAVERGRLKGPPLRVYSLAGLSFKKLGGLKKSFEDLKCQNGVMNFPYLY